MKNIIKSLVILTLFNVIFTSCSDDDKDSPVLIAKPLISELQVGNGADHGKTAEIHIGGDVHIGAEILAEAKIAKIVIEIHNEKTGVEVVEKTYLDFKDQKNAHLHKHIDIPSDAKEGKYHFHLKVIDQAGQTTEAEKEIKLVASTHSHEAIVIEGLGKKQGNEYVMSPGKDAHIGFKVDVKEEIVAINIEIHDEKSDVKIFEKEYTSAKYVGKKEVHFHEHIDIPSNAKKGHAHFHIKVFGKNKKVLAEKEQEVHIE